MEHAPKTITLEQLKAVRDQMKKHIRKSIYMTEEEFNVMKATWEYRPLHIKLTARFGEEK